MKWGSLAPLGLAAVASVFVSAMLWDDQQIVSMRDRAVVSAVYGRVAASPGFDGSEIVLVGSLNENERRWGGQIGHSSLDDNDRGESNIFRSLLGFSGIVENVGFGAQSCPAFPADGAVYVHEGRAFVCLDASEGALPLGACTDAAAGGKIRQVCRHGRGVALRGGCQTHSQDHFVRTAAGVEKFRLGAIGFYREKTGDVCDYILTPKAPGAVAISAGALTSEGKPAWEVSVPDISRAAPESSPPSSSPAQSAAPR